MATKSDQFLHVWDDYSRSPSYVLPAKMETEKRGCRECLCGRVTAFVMTTHRNAHLGKGEPVAGQRMPIVFFQMRFPRSLRLFRLPFAHLFVSN